MSTGPDRRFLLVPRVESEPARAAGRPHVRRYSLARVGVARHSALGMDRHERLERVATGETGRPDPR